jgi:hypothetical protein
MAKGPRGERRPADAIGAAIMVGRIATGETAEKPDSRNPHAVALGRLGGGKGGKARAAKLSRKSRKAIAKKAAAARWKNRD